MSTRTLAHPAPSTSRLQSRPSMVQLQSVSVPQGGPASPSQGGRPLSASPSASTVAPPPPPPLNRPYSPVPLYTSTASALPSADRDPTTPTHPHTTPLAPLKQTGPPHDPNWLPPGQLSVAQLAAIGVIVRDFVNDKRLPPIKPYRPAIVVGAAHASPLRRGRRGNDENENDDDDDRRFSELTSPISESRSPRARSLERAPTEPAVDELPAARALPRRALGFRDFPGKASDVALAHTASINGLPMDADVDMDFASQSQPPFASQSQSQWSSQFPSQLHMPSEVESQSQDSEPYVATPLITPNGSLQWPDVDDDTAGPSTATDMDMDMIVDTSAVPASQLDTSSQAPPPGADISFSQLGFSQPPLFSQHTGARSSASPFASPRRSPRLSSPLGAADRASSPLAPPRLSSPFSGVAASPSSPLGPGPSPVRRSARLASPLARSSLSPAPASPRASTSTPAPAPTTAAATARTPRYGLRARKRPGSPLVAPTPTRRRPTPPGDSAVSSGPHMGTDMDVDGPAPLTTPTPSSKNTKAGARGVSRQSAQRKEKTAPALGMGKIVRVSPVKRSAKGVGVGVVLPPPTPPTLAVGRPQRTAAIRGREKTRAVR